MTRLEKNRLEWSVFGVALLLVLATLAYLVREALTTTSGAPPDIVVTLGQPAHGPAGHQVPVTVENRGGATAQDVRVAVVLEAASSREEAVLVIPFVPRESRRDGWVVFRADPSAGGLRVGGVAYQAP